MFKKRKKTQPLTTRRRVPLSTGGFIEIEPGYDGIPGSGYIRIHLGIPESGHNLDETFKYVRYGTDIANFDLLLEISNACMKLAGNVWMETDFDQPTISIKA
jgi:hypothetical protein